PIRLGRARFAGRLGSVHLRELSPPPGGRRRSARAGIRPRAETLSDVRHRRAPRGRGRRWGEPRRLELEFAITPRERAMIHSTSQPDRAHDVTFFIEHDGRFAVIAKPFFPPGVWRAPSGGLLPGEDIETGAKREALEETGLEIELRHYLLRIEARFTLDGEIEPWRTQVFLTRAASGDLAPRDTREI